MKNKKKSKKITKKSKKIKSKAKTIKSKQKDIQTLISNVGDSKKLGQARYLKQLFKAAIDLARISPGTSNLKMATTIIKELTYSFRVFNPEKENKKITIFGSARTAPDRPTYSLAKEFASEAVKRNFMIITGGGPGVMAAGNEGAGMQHSFGLNISLPHEQSANPFISEKQRLVLYKYFFTRKLFLINEAHAFAMFPGGFGTMDETFEVLTLIQTGKTNLIPLVLMEPQSSDYWKEFINFLNKQLLGRGLISESDQNLYTICHSAKEAMEHIDLFYRNYESMEIKKGKMFLSFKEAINDTQAKKIRKEYAHLSTNGKFEINNALSKKSSKSKFNQLIFPTSRSNFTQIRPLIDFLNQSS